MYLFETFVVFVYLCTIIIVQLLNYVNNCITNYNITNKKPL